jgi:DNA-binding LacI/PurR family transcriptional regulator
MIVDNQSDLHALDYVCCDYRSGAEQTMNYLLQLGHRRIGLITAGQHSKTARAVRETYALKLNEAGILAEAAWVADGEFTEEGGAAAVKKLIAADPGLTAVFAGNDKMAIGAMHQLTQQGLRVPGDVSVVGFDDLRHAAFVNPTLSTIHLPLYEVGATAMERMVERIHGRAEPVRDKLPTHLVVRNSTAMARSVGG